jgi:4-hydroxy-3-polyprenylbenzoate decarboxylase
VQDLVDFIVAPILDHLDLPQDLMPRWGEARVNAKTERNDGFGQHD